MAGRKGVHAALRHQFVPGRWSPAFHTMRSGSRVGIPAPGATRAQQLAFGEPDEKRGVLGITMPVVDLVMVVEDQRIHAFYLFPLPFYLVLRGFQY